MAGTGLGRLGVGSRTLLLACPQPSLSPSLPASFSELLPAGLLRPRHRPRALQRLLPDGTRYLWASPSLAGVGGGCDTLDTLLAEGRFWSLKPVLTLSSVLHSPPAPPGISRGPSPVVLGSQDALPVATVFTEYVHAYFRGHSPRYAVPGRVRTVRGNGAPWGCVSGF